MIDVNMPVTHVPEQVELMNLMMDRLNKDQSNIMYYNDSVDGTYYAQTISNIKAVMNPIQEVAFAKPIAVSLN